ncbi:MAG: hypothetical protein HC764_24775 [Pleurocapsa sp. CRU_1_2]|nr:hypothetical protein [Pleurocapsa sp. CRU_1_2]
MGGIINRISRCNTHALVQRFSSNAGDVDCHRHSSKETHNSNDLLYYLSLEGDILLCS